MRGRSLSVHGGTIARDLSRHAAAGRRLNQPDGILQQVRRPLVSSSLWVPLLLVVVACAGIAYYGHEVAQTLRQSVADNARAGGQATAGEITRFIDREHERLRAFVLDHDVAIRRILAAPDDWRPTEALQTSLKRAFPETIAFSITGPDGVPLFEDFDGLVGPTCQAAMRTFAQTMEFGRQAYEVPPIHPVPGAYHFDLIAPWQLDDGRYGVFFVSMSPQRMAELLTAAEKSSGMRYLLVNRASPDLIEVAAAGARDALGEAIRVAPEDVAPEHFAVDLSGTHWQLLVLPDGAELEAAVDQVYAKVAALIGVLLLVSGALLYLIRRSEESNSTLFMRSLQSSVSRQRAILQSMVDGMVTIDASGRILHVNSAITRLFGYEPGELVDANVRVLMPEPDRSAHDRYLNSYLTTGESKILGKGREVMARRKDGSLFPVMLTLGESVEGDQHIFVGILHDMSAYRDAQRKIVSQAVAIERSRQELDEIGQIAAKDLQQPLQRIASLGEALGAVQDAMLGQVERAQLKDLSAEARDMSELVKGLADYTRVEPPARQSVQLRQVLEEVCRDLGARIEAAAAEVSCDLDAEVLGEPKQLRQLFWNLLDNALKFRDPQRAPRIRVRLDPAPHDAEGQVHVLVEDNGIGIPPEHAQSVFEAFRRLHPREQYPGMGLGLAFCRKIVDGLGGRISVQSEPGQGSVFRVVLPRSGG